MAGVVIEGLTKKYGDQTVIQDLNLEIKDGLFTVLVGPSGCGKTTILRMIAGIEPITAGRIRIDGKEMSHVPPGKRGLAMVHQNYAIYPTMTVRGNIEFGLKNNKVPKPERERLIAEVCQIVGLTPYLNRKPSQLSGGQRQRVALARAMVKKPNIFLMDEPLSNLDAKLRAQMRVELKELHRRLGTTFIYVTHDQVEAMSMADEIVLVENGQIRQVAPPEEMYASPAHIFSAQFIGTPPMNIIALPDNGWSLGVRPSKVRLSAAREEAAVSGPAVMQNREMLGNETHYQIEAPGLGTMMVTSSEPPLSAGMTPLYLAVDEEDLYLFDETGARVPPDADNYANTIASIVRSLHEKIEQES